MTAFKTLLCVVVLAIAHQITAQQVPGWQFPSFSSFGSGNFGGIQLPTFPGLGGSNSSGLASSGLFAFPFQIPNLPGLGSLLSTTSAPAASDGSRRRREAESADDEAAEHQNRLFFSLFPTITTCNYTSQAGTSCPNCQQALRCLPNNVGILTTCSGFFRNCNNGRCSLFASSACSNSTG